MGGTQTEWEELIGCVGGAHMLHWRSSEAAWEELTYYTGGD